METRVRTVVVTLNEAELEKFLKITPDAFGTELQRQSWELSTCTYYENNVILTPNGLADLILYLVG